MKTPQAVEFLSALAHEHRLGIYRLLVAAGPLGLNAGTIADRMHLAPSSLSFHLQHLQRAGLITQQRQSRQLIYATDFVAMNNLVGFLTENCCGQSSAACAPSCNPELAKRPISVKRTQRAA
jgi:DNA-binding transcriptional ArsR family regulator